MSDSDWEVFVAEDGQNSIRAKERKMTKRSTIQSAVEVYVDSLHQTLFLDWDISGEGGKAKAVEFVTDLFVKIEKQIGKQFPTTMSDHFAAGVKEARSAERTDDYLAEYRDHPNGVPSPVLVGTPKDVAASKARHPSRYVGSFDARNADGVPVPPSDPYRVDL